MTIGYLYSKFFKKIVRWKSIINSRIDATATIRSGSNFINSSIGRHSYCGYDCSINYTKIGAFTSIADNVCVGAAEHPLNWVSTSPAFQNVKNSPPKARLAIEDLPHKKKQK